MQQWSDWFDRHGPALLLLARRWSSNQADAEDAVQAAFLKFWPQRERVADPVAYLFGCVRHAAIDAARRRESRQRRDEQAGRAYADHRSEADQFQSRVEADDRRRTIEAALGELPAEQAAVLTMKIWGQLTHKQIAEATETAEGTVASRYRYALQGLRSRLDRELLT